MAFDHTLEYEGIVLQMPCICQSFKVEIIYLINWYEITELKEQWLATSFWNIGVWETVSTQCQKPHMDTQIPQMRWKHSKQSWIDILIAYLTVAVHHTCTKI